MGTLVTWDEFTSGGRPQGGTIREIVLSEVINLVSKRRPTMSLISAGKADSTFIEALTDSYRSRAHNAQPEGIAYTDIDSAQPSRHFVHVQSFYESGRVSDEQRLTSHYTADPLAYQKQKKLVSLLNDIEHAVVRGSAATGATNAARQFSGILNTPPTGANGTFTSVSGVTLSEHVFINLLQTWRTQNLEFFPTVALMGEWLKRSISEFSTKVTRNIEVSAKQQILTVEQHTSDFGTIDCYMSEDQLRGTLISHASNSISFIDPAMLKLLWLRPPTVEDLARDGLRSRFQINAMCALFYRHNKALGGAQNLLPNITTS